MQYPVHLPGFEGRNIVVEASGIFGGPKLLIDGQRAPKGAKRGQYLLRRSSDGREVVASFKSVFPDPIPLLIVDGQTMRLAEPLAWYQWLFAAFPLLLLFIGGALGGFLGALGTMINASLFRSSLPTAARYALSALVGLVSFAVFIAIAAQFQSAR